MSKNDRIAFKINSEVKQKFENACNRNGLSMSEVGRRAIVDELKKLKGDPNG